MARRPAGGLELASDNVSLVDGGQGRRGPGGAGRLLPGISQKGFDAWQAGPLDAADEEWLGRFTAAFPPRAHALPMGNTRPLRVRSPQSLVRECWDATADALARSPAASRLTRSPAFADRRPVRVEAMRDWLETRLKACATTRVPDCD